MKVCIRCRVEKDELEFYSKGKNGRDNRCKECLKNDEEWVSIRKNSLRKWKKNNPKKWEKLNPDKRRSINRRAEAKDRYNLGDCYIKERLRAKGLTTEIINSNPEIIELQRMILLTKRKLKQFL
jgi:hypothetical protein